MSTHGIATYFQPAPPPQQQQQQQPSVHADAPMEAPLASPDGPGGRQSLASDCADWAPSQLDAVLEAAGALGPPPAAADGVAADAPPLASAMPLLGRPSGAADEATIGFGDTQVLDSTAPLAGSLSAPGRGGRAASGDGVAARVAAWRIEQADAAAVPTEPTAAA